HLRRSGHSRRKGGAWRVKRANLERPARVDAHRDAAAAGTDGNRRTQRRHPTDANLFVGDAAHGKRFAIETVDVADPGVVGHEVQAVAVSAPLRVDALAGHGTDERYHVT